MGVWVLVSLSQYKKQPSYLCAEQDPPLACLIAGEMFVKTEGRRKSEGLGGLVFFFLYQYQCWVIVDRMLFIKLQPRISIQQRHCGHRFMLKDDTINGPKSQTVTKNRIGRDDTASSRPVLHNLTKLFIFRSLLS